MKTLFILRHAKSSWADAEMSDFERPLNDRGLKVAAFMGELMADKGLEPYLILSSPAVRARTTAEIVKRSGKLDAEIRYEHRIYEASPQTLRQTISEIDGAYRSVLLVGHNPGIEGLIRFLTGEIEPVPTAALAVIDLNLDEWPYIDEGRGTLRKLYRPKEEMSQR
ncbi:MAG TPA: histidine phosphatase family protein [Pyrinomonadaceae bacterium]|nr:histidine phosphatase family protein [Pyrinomonadaceae bacterium]